MIRPISFAGFIAIVPAIAAVVAAAVATFVLLVAQPDRATLVARYAREADRAIAAGDRSTARLCAQRLLQLDPTDPTNRERLALANGVEH